LHFKVKGVGGEVFFGRKNPHSFRVFGVWGDAKTLLLNQGSQRVNSLLSTIPPTSIDSAISATSTILGFFHTFSGHFAGRGGELRTNYNAPWSENAVGHARFPDLVGKNGGPCMHKNFVDAFMVKMGPTRHVQTGSLLGTNMQGMQRQIWGPATEKFGFPFNNFHFIFEFLFFVLVRFVVRVGKRKDKGRFFVFQVGFLANENSFSKKIGSTSFEGLLSRTKWTGPRSIVLKALSART